MLIELVNQVHRVLKQRRDELREGDVLQVQAVLTGSMFNSKRRRSNDYSTFSVNNECLHRSAIRLYKVDKETFVKCKSCNQVIAKWKKFSDDVYNVDEAYFKRIFILRGKVRELDEAEKELLS